MKFTWWHRLKNLAGSEKKLLQIWVLALLTGAVFLLATLSNVFTETYSIDRFSRAEETIRSPLTIENEKETERKTREVVQAVEDRYNVSEDITAERIDYINELFDAVKVVENDRPGEKENENQAALAEENTQAEQLQNVISPEISQAVTKEELSSLIEADSAERALAQELLTTSLFDVLNKGVRAEDVAAVTNSINEKLRYSSLSGDLKNTLYAISDFAIIENSFFNMEKTVEARKQAASIVEPVMIRAGEVIVAEGEIITTEVYEKLKLVGLLNNDRNFFPLLGLVILVILLSGIVAYEWDVYTRDQNSDKRKAASILLISILMVALMKVISLFSVPGPYFYLLVPAATGAMLLKILLNERLALMLSSVYAILGSLIFNAQIPGSLNIEAGIYFFFSQVAGIICLVNLKDRIAVLKAGAGVIVVHVLTVLLFLFLSIEKYTIQDAFIQSGYGLVAAFLSVVLTIGLLPFFETGLGILSDSKLLTLSNPNHPLLRKILIEAPGTYHHSVMVANLSEAACESIGANGLLARVAAYYHDLGKVERPRFFIENQMGIKNPHDFITPKQSAEIIISHPYDGAALLRKHKLPKEIVDIAEQHHGTTLLKYFYYKEKETTKKVDEQAFRYPGPKPQTKEAAIISICDSVEAAVRSLDEPSKEKIEEIVNAILNDRLLDGQLNESPLTFKDLERIRQAICETLSGMFHSRIKYPTNQKIKEAN